MSCPIKLYAKVTRRHLFTSMKPEYIQMEVCQVSVTQVPAWAVQALLLKHTVQFTLVCTE